MNVNTDSDSDSDLCCGQRDSNVNEDMKKEDSQVATS